MILVTGATGFLGSEVITQLLKRNTAIRAIKRSTSAIPFNLKDAPVEWRDADILNYFDMEEALDEVKQVYHCAAIISFDPSEKKRMIALNTESTALIVNLCLEKNIRLVHVSSIAALGEAKDGELVTEKNIWEYSSNESGYAISKYQSEMEVWRGMAEGLDAVIVNPSIIIGKNCSTGSIRFFDLIKKGLKFYPTGNCGLVDVEDVAFSMITLMESDVTAERFIISAENWTYENFFKEIAVNYGIEPPSIKVRPWLLKLAVPFVKMISVITGNEYGLTPETVRSAFNKRQYDNTKIKKTININFKPINKAISEACKTTKSE